MRASIAVPCGCSPAPGSTGRTNIRRSPSRGVDRARQAYFDGERVRARQGPQFLPPDVVNWPPAERFPPLGAGDRSAGRLNPPPLHRSGLASLAAVGNARSAARAKSCSASDRDRPGAGEACVYDPRSGQLLSGSFMDYAMPRADLLPAFDTEISEVPSTTNPLGMRGGSEGGITPGLAAVARLSTRSRSLASSISSCRQHTIASGTPSGRRAEMEPNGVEGRFNQQN